MREIGFRGKSILLKEFVYGFILQYEAGTFITDGIILSQVDPETVGQYTGLTDKNGKQIFEGDILLWKYLPSSKGKNMLVDYENKFAGFVVKFEDKEHGIWNEFCKTVEVIGNIYDNPELLGSAE